MERDLDTGDPAAGFGGFGFEVDDGGVAVRFDFEDIELPGEVVLFAGESGFEEREGAAPGAGLGAGEGVDLGAFESWVEEDQLFRFTDGDGAGGLAEFPAEEVGGFEPDAALGDEGLGEGLERAGLGDFG